MEAWNELYKELAEKITANLPQIQWVDLWHEQISYLTDELPFPAPAVFIAFRTNNIDDKGLKIQDLNMQIDMYLFFETFSDTYQGAYNQNSALDFLATLTDLLKLFHAHHGVNYGQMRRVFVGSEESGNAGNLYRVSFSCNVEDAAAMNIYDMQEVNEVSIDKVEITNRPSTQDDNPLYTID